MRIPARLSLPAVLLLAPCCAPAAEVSEDFDALHAMLRPQSGELLWMKVPWVTSITLARHQAAVENKPILIFAVAGAGFSDPLGIC